MVDWKRDLKDLVDLSEKLVICSSDAAAYSEAARKLDLDEIALKLRNGYSLDKAETLAWNQSLKHKADCIFLTVKDTVFCDCGEAKRVFESLASENSVNQTLASRQSVYGDFKEVARTATRLKSAIRRSDAILSAVHREAIDMIMTKIARIVNGNPDHEDSVLDIAGYATLMLNDIRERKRVSAEMEESKRD